jgi:hypothetical protein
MTAAAAQCVEEQFTVPLVTRTRLVLPVTRLVMKMPSGDWFE